MTPEDEETMLHTIIMLCSKVGWRGSAKSIERIRDRLVEEKATKRLAEIQNEKEQANMPDLTPLAIFTVLHIQMLLHYHTVASPYAFNDPAHADSPAVQEYRRQMLKWKLIRPTNGAGMYTTTDTGAAIVERLKVEVGRMAGHFMEEGGSEEDQEKPALGSDFGDFQQRVVKWLYQAFDREHVEDTTIRSHRFLEEACELVQAVGCSRGAAHQIVDYVFDRKVGSKGQEVGGTVITLVALCHAEQLNMGTEAEKELIRIWKKLGTIRHKQSVKPVFTDEYNDVTLPIPIGTQVAIDGGDCKGLVTGYSIAAEGFQAKVEYWANGILQTAWLQTERLHLARKD